jgi:hypothetical protein
MGQKNNLGVHHGNLLAHLIITSYMECWEPFGTWGTNTGSFSQFLNPPNHPSFPRPPGPTLSWSCFRQLYLKKNKILGLIQLILIDALIEITFLRVLFLSKKILLFLAKWTGGTDEMGGGEGMMMHFGYGYPPFPSLGYLLWANYSPSSTQWTHRTRVVELI